MVSIKDGLDFQTYRSLLKLTSRNSRTQAWFRESYGVFINEGSPESREDFYKYVAFAYSWMPTIPSVRAITPGEWKKISRLLKTAPMNEPDLKKLLLILVPIINNSLVGTSKVLHFINPDQFPILDSRVIRTWNDLFKDNRSLRIKSVLQRLTIEGRADVYLKYRQYLKDWKEKCGKNVSLRHIEKALFGLGYPLQRADKKIPPTSPV